MSFPVVIRLSVKDTLETSTTNKWGCRLGTKGEDEFGRTFRLAKAGIAIPGYQRLLINGNFCPAATGHEGVNGYEGNLHAAAAAGDTVVQTAETTARAANYYEGGWMSYFSATVQSSIPIVSSKKGTGVYVELTLGAPLPVALTVAMGVDSYCNPYSNIRKGMDINSGFESFMGVALCAVASGSYFWLQTAGPCQLESSGTYIGATTICREAFAHIDGCVQEAAATEGRQNVGYVISATVNAYGDLFCMLKCE